MNAQVPLDRRTIALVGLMGVGKSTIGRRLALALRLPFRDADAEIEAAAGRSVSEIFQVYGEAAFRDGERRVIARLLDEPPHVLATGGGAVTHPATRDLIRAKAVSIWLKTDLEVLARRLGRRDHRPLLIGKDPLTVLREQAAAREALFAQADIVVETGDTAHQTTVDAVIAALKLHLESAA
jgi:shikimate kinase